MSPYQIIYEDKQYDFQSISEAQAFIDKLPSGAQLKMTGFPLLQQLLNAPGAPLTNWLEIVKEIDNEWNQATTTEHRVALLETFKATMDVAETTIAPENLEKFRDTRLKNYKSFIVQEALIGKNICVETMDEVTRREIAAGRMSPDDNLRRIALEGMAAPHQSRAELIAMDAEQRARAELIAMGLEQRTENKSAERPPKNAWRRFLDWI